MDVKSRLRLRRSGGFEGKCSEGTIMQREEGQRHVHLMRMERRKMAKKNIFKPH
jgi:hypothetical protein